MSSVLDAIRRVLGRDRGTRPEVGDSTEAAPSFQEAAAEPAMPATAGEPAPAMPEEEAELPIQPTAPPMTSPSLPGVPVLTTSTAGTESPGEAGAVLESTEVTEAEHVVEPSGPTGTQSGDAPEPLETGSETGHSVLGPGVVVEETVQHIIGDESPEATVGQVTAIEDTRSAIVVEEPATDQDAQGQALADEPLLPSEVSQVLPSPQGPQFDESLESATATQPARQEESPEQQSAVQSPQPPAPDENR